ncbi:hypothetical protein SKP52_16360 [Sphingopyxis fribergensis]|uniref:Uncharacterized protein n=1 Tax=Sphingopyxis fribergensis TaxID=1515612 RepID=A0A0A7PJ67_9SPHN|nr:hypothetical protein [Sphingopyxis fribergensis]AJA10146.1 hypothetical protein SKP52_16360 [Sphingopyxis fribergensis]
MAAAYLGISERMFDQVRTLANFPQSIKFGRRILWDRKALDVFVDRLSAEALEPYDPWDDILARKPSNRRKRTRSVER